MNNNDDFSWVDINIAQNPDGSFPITKEAVLEILKRAKTTRIYCGGVGKYIDTDLLIENKPIKECERSLLKLVKLNRQLYFTRLFATKTDMINSITTFAPTTQQEGSIFKMLLNARLKNEE